MPVHPREDLGRTVWVDVSRVMGHRHSEPYRPVYAFSNSANAVIALVLYINDEPPPM